MSVINQMLRDLDERRAPTLAPAGTVPVAPVQTLPHKRGRPVFGWVLLVAVVGAVAAFVFLNEDLLLRKDAPPIAPASPVAAAPAPPAAVTPASFPASVPAPAPVDVPALPASEPVVLIPEVVASAQVPSASKAPAARVDATSTSIAAAVNKFEPKLALPRAPAPSSPVPANQARTEQRQDPSTEATASVDPGQRQLQAGRDALAQAQSLWNGGSRDAALELLQQAMDAAQRNTAGAPTPAANSLLATLAREWSRMQLAEGRVGKVWETLTRLEAQLRGEPDLWAVRANAAQRLGRHQDSVHAYMVALESRPIEQRWLLGAAVSLAAMGKTESASEMAEKGRAAGPISRDVQTYLRQMGVPLKE